MYAASSSYVVAGPVGTAMAMSDVRLAGATNLRKNTLTDCSGTK